jgi:uncharacterized protein (TIGR03435 family)
MNILSCAFVCGIAAVATLEWDIAAQARKRFEVASIRPLEKARMSRASSVVTGTRFDAVRITPKELVARAFGIDDTARVIGPEWANRDSFDIRAVMPDGSTQRDVPEMLQTLLVERFSLKMHVEQRPFAVYELVVGPSGHRMKEVAEADDLQKDFPINPDLPAPPSDVVIGLPGDETRTVTRFYPDAIRLTTVTRRTVVTETPGPNTTRLIDATRITMAEFARLVRSSVDRPVVDKTGLTAVYAFKTTLPPRNTSPEMQAMLATLGIQTELHGVSVDRSLDQLELKLVPRNTPVEFVVIDLIERPTPN